MRWLRFSFWRSLITNPQYRLGQKLVHFDSHTWVPAEQFFAVSSENTDFPKKLCNMKIFSIRFAIKKVISIFGVRWLLKNAYVPQNFFWCELTFGSPCINRVVQQSVPMVQKSVPMVQKSAPMVQSQFPWSKSQFPWSKNQFSEYFPNKKINIITLEFYKILKDVFGVIN